MEKNNKLFSILKYSVFVFIVISIFSLNVSATENDSDSDYTGGAPFTGTCTYHGSGSEGDTDVSFEVNAGTISHNLANLIQYKGVTMNASLSVQNLTLSNYGLFDKNGKVSACPKYMLIHAKNSAQDGTMMKSPAIYIGTYNEIQSKLTENNYDERFSDVITLSVDQHYNLYCVYGTDKDNIAMIIDGYSNDEMPDWEINNSNGGSNNWVNVPSTRNPEEFLTNSNFLVNGTLTCPKNIVTIPDTSKNKVEYDVYGFYDTLSGITLPNPHSALSLNTNISETNGNTNFEDLSSSTSYDEYTCTYKGQKTNSQIKIETTSETQLSATLPDGTSKTITSYGFDSSCPDLYYVSKDQTIKGNNVASTSGLPNSSSSSQVFRNLCETYTDDEIEHFCSGECDNRELVCSFSLDANVDNDCSAVLGDLLDLLNKYFGWIKIIAVVLLILYGSLTFAQAVLSNDQDALKKATSKFVKSCIAAILIYFLPFLINLLVNMPGIDITDAVCGLK